MVRVLVRVLVLVSVMDEITCPNWSEGKRTKGPKTTQSLHCVRVLLWLQVSELYQSIGTQTRAPVELPYECLVSSTVLVRYSGW